MKNFNRYIIIAVLVLASALFSACERTELCYDHYPTVAFSFNWEKEWERDYGAHVFQNWDAAKMGHDYDYFRPDMPEWIHMMEYRGEETVGEHFFYPAGGKLILDEQDGLSFLFYNTDSRYLMVSDIASLSDARISTTSRSRASISYIMEKYPDVRSVNPPDVLFASYIEQVPHVEYHQVLPIEVKMQPLVFTYLVRYEFEYGLQHVNMARGALAGMAESVFLRDGNTSDKSVIILYDCDVTDYGCEAQVRSFGVPGFPDEYYGRIAGRAAERPYTLNLEVLLTNGTTVEFNYDVTDQIKNQPRGGIITITGIRIEDEQNTPGSGGGFVVDLSGWNKNEQDLPI